MSLFADPVMYIYVHNWTSVLLHVTLAQDMPFCQPQQLQLMYTFMDLFCADTRLTVHRPFVYHTHIEVSWSDALWYSLID